MKTVRHFNAGHTSQMNLRSHRSTLIITLCLALGDWLINCSTDFLTNSFIIAVIVSFVLLAFSCIILSPHLQSLFLLDLLLIIHLFSLLAAVDFLWRLLPPESLLQKYRFVRTVMRTYEHTYILVSVRLDREIRLYRFVWLDDPPNERFSNCCSPIGTAFHTIEQIK